MIEIVKSTVLHGLDGRIVQVEVDVSRGLPCFDIVGLPDTSVREAKDRVRAAIKNSGFEFPVKRITVNLAPADLKKEGPIYDLPIAVGILAATEQLPPERCRFFAYLGELSLNGYLRGVNGVLPSIWAVREASSLNKVIVPEENAAEAALVDGVDVFPCGSLAAVGEFLRGESEISPYQIDLKELMSNNSSRKLDFADVKGQQAAKRALEVAAAGGHNLVMMGSPGSGKTMLARRLPGILPDLTFQESMEATKIYSLAGKLEPGTPLVANRPFRAPHHTASAISIIGGGRVPRPGEVSLAHNGVLFLDEMPEFHKDALEALRQPLEDGVVTISRVNASLTYPARLMLVGALNPCPCGSKVQTISFQVACGLSQEPDLSTVGARLKQTRLSKGLTIKQLAGNVGMSEVTLGRWEKNLGKIENYPDKVKKICQLLNIGVNYLFDELKDNSFSAVLKKARFEMGLSRKELAQALGVDKGTVLCWERGGRMVKYEEKSILNKICELQRRGFGA